MTATGGRMSAGAAKMQRDRKTICCAGFQDRPVAPAPKRLEPAWRDLHLRKAAVTGTLFDLGYRGLLVLHIHLDRSLQPRIGIAPARELPLVDRSRHRRTKLDIALAACFPDQWRQQPICDVEQIEQLRLH